MPELPEVETVRRGLEPVMVGRRIEAASINRPDLRWPFPDNMRERLVGTRTRRLARRSKYLLVDLDSGETLIVHLGMSGRLLIRARDEVAKFHNAQTLAAKHDHVVLTLEDGATVTFNDPRRFGAMDLAPTAAVEDHHLLARLGPEPLGNAFHADYLKGVLNGKKTPIKSALLDQRLVAGLGNIYVCEALWRSGISPLRLAGRIGGERIGALLRSIRETLDDAIAAGGSSLRDYRQADGELGYFQHSFRVYDREGDPCCRAECDGVIRRVVQSGRSTFYCPRCQR